jgi:hypothetical protein
MSSALSASPRAELRIERRRLLRELASQRAHCQQRSAFYVAVLAEIETDAADSPAWLDRVEHAWRDREFAVGWEAAHLLLANLHYAALSGESPALASVYPSCGGSGRPAGEVAAFLREAPPAFWARLADHFVQTNEVDRSVPWLLVAAAAFGARSLPFHFVEMGSSAGLNLVGDHLAHECEFVGGDGVPREPPPGWDRRPQAIRSRTGLDIRPRDLRNAGDRLWLKACVWADHLDRLARLDEAVAVFLALQGTPGAPRLAECDFEHSPGWLLENRPARPDEGLLVFNSIGTIYLSAADYAGLRAGMAEALAPWGDRGFWVEYERARSSTGPLQLAVHRVIDGKLRTRVLGSGEPRPRRMSLEDGWDFSSGR